MKAVFKLENVDTTLATCTVTMTIGEWRALAESLRQSNTWIAQQFEELIRNIVSKAEAWFIESGTKG